MFPSVRRMRSILIGSAVVGIVGNFSQAVALGKEDGIGKCGYDESEKDIPLHWVSLRLERILGYG